MVGIEGPPSITIGFAKPQMASQLLAIEPLAALEMPMRIAVRDVGGGNIKVIYYKPSYLFSHYGNDKLTGMAKKKISKPKPQEGAAVMFEATTETKKVKVGTIDQKMLNVPENYTLKN